LVLPFTLGAVLNVSGKVPKVVNRDEQCKLVIEPGDLPYFVVFVDCQGHIETVRIARFAKVH